MSVLGKSLSEKSSQWKKVPLKISTDKKFTDSQI